MEKNVTNTSPAAVAARVKHMRFCHNNHDADLIEALASQLSAANTRADQAYEDAASFIEETAYVPEKHHRYDCAAKIRALRYKPAPAPAVTVQEAAMVLLTYLSETQDSVVWETTEDAMAVPMADPGDVIFAALRAIAGGGDE